MAKQARKNKNAYELTVPNKWFSRYLNFVYNLELGAKTKPKIPKILKNKKHLVLRGLFDTDGSIKEYRVSIGTKYPALFKEIVDIIDSFGLKYRIKINKIQRKNEVYTLEIKKECIVNFIRNIGFSHPRKIIEVGKYLWSNFPEKG